MKQNNQPLNESNGAAGLTLPYRVEERGLPLPVWAKRPLDENPDAAWSALRETCLTAVPERSFCIYVHVPFCESHCAFCDCYAFALRRGRAERLARYAEALLAEVDLWAALLPAGQRPVSTVHLGGGTPAMLGTDYLQSLIGRLKARFAVSPETEWALESTSSSLTNAGLNDLFALGFRRLHIGVQSLQDDVRRRIGRRESGAALVGRIQQALALGWVVSVDLIVGLPGQQAAGLLNDIQRLAAVGVEGFSIYELQHSHRNHMFFEQQALLNRPAAHNYRLFQRACLTVRDAGFHPNLFNHWSAGRDRNLYFTFPQRGEDLLALGAIADGVFGNYHYRHAEYLPYLRDLAAGRPGLLGGLRRTPREEVLRRLEVMLLGAAINAPVMFEILGAEAAGSLLDGWLKYGLIKQEETAGVYGLTPNGAWFIGRMLDELNLCLA